MNLKKVQLELDISDVQQVLAIALDEDKDKALEYIKARLVKQIEKVLQPHWVPVFEASYGPGKSDRFNTWFFHEN